MERQTRPNEHGTGGSEGSSAWFLVLLALAAWQGWLTFSLFMPAEAAANETTFRDIPRALSLSWNHMLDDQPVVSGRHPLHLYFGYLGAQSFRERGELCVYDPSFQAGYPKTPVFDSGSRPAELFLMLARGKFSPAAYKLGMAAFCCLIPWLFALAAWGAGVSRGPACLVVALGLMLQWGSPGKHLLREGDLDLLLAGMAGLVWVCVLIRFDRSPGLLVWLCLLGSTTAVWFGEPFFFLLLAPLGLIYYLSVGARHGFGWHLSLMATQLGAILLNGFWLIDWARYWWIRLPLHVGAETLRQRTLHTLWTAPLWGDDADQALAALLLALAIVGVIVLNQNRERPAARMLGLGSIGMLALVVGGLTWQQLGRFGTERLLVPALWFAVIPAVHALSQSVRALARKTGRCWAGAVLGLALPLLVALAAPRDTLTWMERCSRAEPLAIGLGNDRSELVETLRKNTSKEARILWEDRTARQEAPRWSALLPLLTDRAYLGGLDPDASIEHAYASFIDRSLADRPISSWTDDELEDFCRRYNVGWVACWSPEAIARLDAWTKGAARLASLDDEGTGRLFGINRPHSFILKGQARWLGADLQHISLADVTPEDGRIVLSLHYQAGMQVSPARVQIEREQDPFDPIPFVRLRVSGSVARIMLTWEDR